MRRFDQYGFTLVPSSSKPTSAEEVHTNTCGNADDVELYPPLREAIQWPDVQRKAEREHEVAEERDLFQQYYITLQKNYIY